MKLVIEENEKTIENNKDAVTKMEVSRRRESVEMNDLKSVVECKGKEIESLNKKVYLYFVFLVCVYCS